MLLSIGRTPFLRMSSFGPPLSIPELADKLIQHGVRCRDDKERELIETRLRSIAYYKLEEYSWPFRTLDDPALNTRKSSFKTETPIGLIWNNYLFDRRLRLLLMDAVERIECAVKNLFSQVLVEAAGHNHPQSERQLFPNFQAPQKPDDKDQYETWLGSMQKALRRDDSPRTVFSMADHHVSDVVEIPIWLLMEVCSYGAFRNLLRASDPNIQSTFAKEIRFPLDFVRSSLKLFNKVRNKCAHHRRIWNLSWSATPKPRKRNKMTTPYFTAKLGQEAWYSAWDDAQHKWTIPNTPQGKHSVGVRSTAFVILLAKVWLDHVAQTSHWKERVEEVVSPAGELTKVAEDAGFPEHFFEHPLWQNKTP